MINTSKCVACGDNTAPILSEGKIARIKINHIKPDIGPFSLFICLKCGYWNMFSLEIRNGTKEMPPDQVPEKVKRDLGLK